MFELDAATEAYVEDLVAAAPAFTAEQVDVLRRTWARPDLAHEQQVPAASARQNAA